MSENEPTTHEISAEVGGTSSTAFPAYEPSAGVEVATTAPEAPKPTLRRFFVGDDGLRAGWSVLLFIGVAVLLTVCAAYLAKHLHLVPGAPAKGANGSSILSPRLAGAGELLQFTVLALAAYLMSLIERRPFSRYGLGATRMLPDLLMGLFWGFAALSALVAALYALHAIAFDGFLLHGTVAVAYAFKWAVVFLLVGLLEEYLFRGYLLYTVSRGVAGITRAMDPANKHSHAIGFWVSAAIFSIGLFMLAHLGNGGENWVGIFQVGLVGAVFAFSLYRTGSLWWAVGMHASWDWAQSYFYGTADSGTIAIGRLMASHPVGSKLLSGGADGPEGSVLGIPTLLVMAAVIHFTLPKRDYPLTADQT